MSETLHNKGLHNSYFSALTRDALITIFGADHWSRPWEAWQPIRSSVDTSQWVIYYMFISNADLKVIYGLIDWWDNLWKQP